MNKDNDAKDGHQKQFESCPSGSSMSKVRKGSSFFNTYFHSKWYFLSYKIREIQETSSGVKSEKLMRLDEVRPVNDYGWQR